MLILYSSLFVLTDLISFTVYTPGISCHVDRLCIFSTISLKKYNKSNFVKCLKLLTNYIDIKGLSFSKQGVEGDFANLRSHSGLCNLCNGILNIFNTIASLKFGIINIG